MSLSIDPFAKPSRICAACWRTRVLRGGVWLCLECDRARCPSCGTTAGAAETACRFCEAPHTAHAPTPTPNPKTPEE